MNTFEEEIKNGERFAFGKNWRAFLANLNEERIREAEKSILALLDLNDLKGKRFLDVGSGSGLFSLAARRLGAIVTSFDYDPASVACTSSLRSRYFRDDRHWLIIQGSILDDEFVRSLGNFDVVYSWGVLHHTGNMWKALDNVAALPAANGTLCVAIYNDLRWASRFWWGTKKLFCSGYLGKCIVCSVFVPCFGLRAVAGSILRRQSIFSTYKRRRGMSIVRDWMDWLGGFPYEVAKVENIFRFYRDRGYVLRNIVTSAGLGNNQFVFVRTHSRGDGTDERSAWPIVHRIESRKS